MLDIRRSTNIETSSVFLCAFFNNVNVIWYFKYIPLVKYQIKKWFSYNRKLERWKEKECSKFFCVWIKGYLTRMDLSLVPARVASTPPFPGQILPAPGDSGPSSAHRRLCSRRKGLWGRLAPPGQIRSCLMPTENLTNVWMIYQLICCKNPSS